MRKSDGFVEIMLEKNIYIDVFHMKYADHDSTRSL